MMAHKRFFLVPLLLLAGCATAPAPEVHYIETTDELHAAAHGISALPATLPEEAELNGPHPVAFYLQIALERNPEILAAQRAVTAQVHEIPQVTSLENPMVTNSFWPIPENSPQTASGRMPYSLMVSQEFPWLGKLRLRGEVAEQETKIALTELAQAQLQVIESVQLAYYEVYYYQKAISITEENEKLLDDFIRFAEIRFRTGGSQQDVLRAQLEKDRLREQLIGFRQQLKMAQADLNSLLHASPELEPLALEEWDSPETPEAIEKLYEAAVHCRPELQARLHAIVRDQRRRELAVLNYYPDFTAGVSWDAMTREEAISPVADGKDNLGFTVGISVPLWRERIHAGVQQAENRVLESARRYDATRDDTFRQIRRLIAQADAAQQQIDLFEEAILPRTEQTLEVSIADYRVGKVDFLQVIDNYSELLTFRVQFARLQTNLGQAMASLERAVGCQVAMLPDSAEASTITPGAPAPAPLETDESNSDDTKPETDQDSKDNKDQKEDKETVSGTFPESIQPASFGTVERSQTGPRSSCRPVGKQSHVLVHATELQMPEENQKTDTEENKMEEDAKREVVLEPFCPLLGAGYLPYAYPGFDMCPCGADGCFPPAAYCDPCYREQWFRKWLRAHLGHGSMLEDVPCPCIVPTMGRPYLLRYAQPATSNAEENATPKSEDADSSEDPSTT